MMAVRSFALRAFVVLAGAALLACSSSSGSPASAGDDGDDGGDCYPDNDGVNAGAYTFDLTVDDTGFSKSLLTTQNSATVTVNLTNNGSTPHGFQVGCVDVTSSYPDLPAGCATTACFPTNSAIAPIAPGATSSITFDTPVPDNLIYPFTSNEPADSAVPGLNNGQWSLM